MLYAVTEALLSGAIIAMAPEVAKRSPALGAVILSLPLVSLIPYSARMVAFAEFPLTDVGTKRTARRGAISTDPKRTMLNFSP